MRRTRSVTLVLCLFCTLALHAAPGLTGEIRATTPREVLFSGITPGGTLVVFGMSLSYERGHPMRSSVAELVVDSDGDGTAIWAPQGGVPPRSGYMAVDLTDGTLCFVSPPGYSFARRDLLPASLMAREDGLYSAVNLSGDRMDLLLVRPGAGAWLQQGGEGGTSDADGVANGVLRLSFDTGEKLRSDFQEAPVTVKTGDVLATIDLRAMRMNTLTVTQERASE